MINFEDFISKPAPVAAPVEVTPKNKTVLGPVTPQPGCVPIPSDLFLPVDPACSPAPLWWVGVHGGSGESTLSSLSAWPGSNHCWPRHIDGSVAGCVLVCRSNKTGLDSASQALRVWASGLVPWVRLIGVVVCADAPGRLPRDLKDSLRIVSGGAGRVWRISWQENWRTGLAGEPGRDVLKVFDEISSVI